MNSPSFLTTIVAFALVIGPLVFLHELGHYLAGRWFDVKADEFSIGFGREVFGITDRRGTRWKFCLLPLGGYVKFAGDMDASSRSDPMWRELPDAERAQTFPAKPLWQRAITVAAGPITNLLIAFLILTGFALAYGDLQTPPVIGSVAAGSPAAQAGLAPGDRITALAGRHVRSFEDIVSFVVIRPGETVEVQAQRDGQTVVRDLTIGRHDDVDRFGHINQIGRIGVGNTRQVIVPVSPIQAPVVAVRMMRQIVGMMGDTIGQIIVGERSVKDLGGPLKIAQVSGEQLSLGIGAFVFLIALVSINLGFINLLPVPVLDGGHLLFYAIEAVRRRPVEPHVQEWAFRGGLAAVLALMLMVTFNDLGSFGLWHSLTGLIG
jgi:regulator of sigma E protease